MRKAGRQQFWTAARALSPNSFSFFRRILSTTLRRSAFVVTRGPPSVALRLASQASAERICDGAVHDDPAQVVRDLHVCDTLVGLGYRVIVGSVAERIAAILASSGGVPTDVHGCVGAGGSHRAGRRIPAADGANRRGRRVADASRLKCRRPGDWTNRAWAGARRGSGRRGQCGGGARAERFGGAFSSGAVSRGTSCTSCRCRRGTDRSSQPWEVEGSSRSPPETACGTRTPSCPGSCSRRSRPDR